MKLYRDDYIRFSTFFKEVYSLGGNNFGYVSGYQLSGVGGWDLIGWEFFDFTPTYGWAFGRIKSIIEENKSSFKLTNSFIGFSLGLDIKFNLISKSGKGFSIGLILITFGMSQNQLGKTLIITKHIFLKMES